MRRGALFVSLLVGCSLTSRVGLTGSSTSEPASASSASQGSRPAASVAAVTSSGNCDPAIEKDARARGYLKGPCWDPPGRISFAEKVTIVPGRREVAPDVYWFEMPKEGKVNGDGCVHLPGTMTDTMWTYLPYDDEGGLPPFTLPDVTGKTVAEVLDLVDALDRPACVKIRRDPSCNKPHGIVCRTSQNPDAPFQIDGHIGLVVATDVLDEGTPKETRRLSDFTDKPIEEARAALAKRFTTVEVEETDLPCERGLVCDISPSVNQFYPKERKITLKIRRAKR